MPLNRAAPARYRSLPVQMAAGHDLAHLLRPVWTTIELFAQPLDQLWRQLAGIQVSVEAGGVLCVKIALAAPHQQLRLLLSEAGARYYWERNGELVAIDPHESQLDRAVYLILAELARESAPRESLSYVES